MTVTVTWAGAHSQVLPHQIHHVVIEPPGGVQAPEEVQMLPLGEELAVQHVGDLEQQHGDVIDVRQRVPAAAPHGGGHEHVSHVVKGRRGLRTKATGSIAVVSVYERPSQRNRH